MARPYDVAIVGGGVIGLSVAKHLRSAGVDSVLLLEREGAVGQGSSSRANGGARAQFTTAINISFSLYSIGEFEELNRQSNGLPAFHQTGYLLLTGVEQRAEQLRAASELQKSLGVQTQWLSPGEIAALAPLVRLDGLRAGTFHARDGFLDPHGVIETMRIAARNAGAEIKTRAEVRAIEWNGLNAFRLDTARGTVDARWVVNAAGSHARRVGEMVGVRVPVYPVRRNLAFARLPSDPPGLIPMCVDLDTGVLVRREVGGGYMIAYSNPADPPGWDTSVDPKFLDELAERIGNRFPTLQEASIDPRQCWAGLYPETKDHHAIIGPAPEIDRFVLCVGFGGHGIMHSPAAGKAVAEIITEGECHTFDVHTLRPQRFAEDDLVVETVVL